MCTLSEQLPVACDKDAEHSDYMVQKGSFRDRSGIQVSAMMISQAGQICTGAGQGGGGSRAGGGCQDADSTSSLQGERVGHRQIDVHWGKETSKSCCRMFPLSRGLYQGSIQLCAALLLSAAKSKGMEDTSTLQD